MEIGVFSRTYETGDLEETYRRMKGHGICVTQFNLSNAGLPTLPGEIREEDLDRIRRITKAYGIRIDALTGTFNMIDPDVSLREMGCRQFAVQCRIARELEIPVVSLCTGSKNPKSKWMWHDDNLKDSSWDDLMRSTEEILKYAEENRVILGVETETSNIINTPERARKYLDMAGSPHLKIIMDGANLFRPEQVPDMKKVLEEAFDLLGADIVLVHAKDFTADPAAGTLEYVAPGRGMLDYGLYVRLLERSGYQGALIMHGLAEEEIPRSRDYLLLCQGQKPRSAAGPLAGGTEGD